MATVGLVSPGAMGAAVGACAVAGGSTVVWASEGRGEATTARAERAGLQDVGDVRSLCADADVVLSICPPHAALETAQSVAAAQYQGLYVEANAIAPATARDIARTVEPAARFVDGGIIGGPPTKPGTTRLYLAGGEAPDVASLFQDGPLEAIVLEGDVPAASALKIAFAAWTKGTSALLLTVRAYAAAEQVEDDLLGEWARSRPDLPDRTESTAAQVSPKAWRWITEMEQIAEAFATVGLPEDFHRGAAEVYRRLSERRDSQDTSIEEVVSDLLTDGT